MNNPQRSEAWLIFHQGDTPKFAMRLNHCKSFHRGILAMFFSKENPLLIFFNGTFPPNQRKDNQEKQLRSGLGKFRDSRYKFFADRLCCKSLEHAWLTDNKYCTQSIKYSKPASKFCKWDFVVLIFFDLQALHLKITFGFNILCMIV